MHTPSKHVTVYQQRWTTARPQSLLFACGGPFLKYTWEADTQVFAPSHGPIFGEDNASLAELVPLAIQNPVLFEGLVALSQCHLMAKYDLSRPNKEGLFHRGQALQLLRRKVKFSSTPPDDAIIWTSILLLGIDVSKWMPE
jgi:hypothetical protein